MSLGEKTWTTKRGWNTGRLAVRFAQCGVEYVNSVPRIRIGQGLTERESLFTAQPAGSPIDHVVIQLGWIVSQHAKADPSSRSAGSAEGFGGPDTSTFGGKLSTSGERVRPPGRASPSGRA
jgi:hypothetical protein